MNPLNVFFIALSVILFVCLLRAISSPVDDEAAGVLLGPASQPSTPQPSPSGCLTKHFLSVCMYCHRVTTVHGGRGAVVLVGEELRVSHGICDACMAERHPEVAAGCTTAALALAA